MTTLARELFVGPAVVVDDEVDQADTEARAVVTQLEGASFPVLRRKLIPSDDEIAHWGAMSLIVLDWDLLGAGGLAASDDGTAEDLEPDLLGVSLPESVKSDPRTDTRRFVRKLLSDLYCPIFIISNHDVDGIWAELEDGLDEEEVGQVRARVLVRSKTQESDSLLNGLEEWISQHPAIYALKTWERGYERAKAELFADFQRSAIDWPAVLWRTSDDDGVNPNHDLTETISRNLLHRMQPNLFSAELIESVENQGSLQSVRRVLHQHAVLAAERLHDDVLMPGDFFYPSGDGEAPPLAIEICLTPACDLVPRGVQLDDVQMFVVRATLVPDSDLSTAKAIKRKLEAAESTTSVLLHHLVPDDAMYVVRFKDWSVTTWGEMKEKRRGRLLDPYVTLLQQRNALYSQRQGLPRLPDSFYEPRGASKA